MPQAVGYPWQTKLLKCSSSSPTAPSTYLELWDIRGQHNRRNVLRRRPQLQALNECMPLSIIAQVPSASVCCHRLGVPIKMREARRIPTLIFVHAKKEQLQHSLGTGRSLRRFAQRLIRCPAGATTAPIRHLSPALVAPLPLCICSGWRHGIRPRFITQGPFTP